MLKRAKALVLGVVVTGGIGAIPGCEGRFAHCWEGLNCPGDGNSPGFSGGTSPGGDNSGGATSPSGGSKAGGAGNVGGSGGSHAGGSHTGGAGESGGMAGEGSGGAAPLPCNGKCKDDTPFCDEKTDKCVGCLKHTDCEAPTMPMCSLAKECVPCLDDSSCTDTLGLTDKVVCLDGSTDDQTLEERPDTGACAECGKSGDCDGDICDLESLTCLNGFRFRQSAECDPCENDLECIEGQMCVEQVFNDPVTLVDVSIGKFCTWTKAAVVGPSGDCANIEAGENQHRPFVQELISKNAAGEDGVFCALARTTCLGYTEHGQQKPDCDKDTAALDQAAADAACGAPDVSDSLCRPVSEGSSTYACTYTCVGTKDCRKGTTCPTSGSAQFSCSL